MATYSQSVSLSGASTGTTRALAYSTANLTAGSFLIGVFAWNDQTSTCSVSDSSNGAWTALGSALLGSGGLAGWSSQFFYFANNAATVKPTVTMTTTNSNPERDLAIFEYKFAGAGGAIEGSAQYSNASGTTPSSSTVTPVSSSDFCFAYNFNSGSVSAVNAPFTQRESANFGGNSVDDDLAPVGGTGEHDSWTTVGSDSMTGIVVVSLPASVALTPNIAVVDFAVARSTSY